MLRDAADVLAGRLCRCLRRWRGATLLWPSLPTDYGWPCATAAVTLWAVRALAPASLLAIERGSLSRQLLLEQAHAQSSTNTRHARLRVLHLLSIRPTPAGLCQRPEVREQQVLCGGQHLQRPVLRLRHPLRQLRVLPDSPAVRRGAHLPSAVAACCHDTAYGGRPAFGVCCALRRAVWAGRSLRPARPAAELLPIRKELLPGQLRQEQPAAQMRRLCELL